MLGWEASGTWAGLGNFQRRIRWAAKVNRAKNDKGCRKLLFEF
jgi:hypothetical protein